MAVYINQTGKNSFRTAIKNKKRLVTVEKYFLISSMYIVLQ